MKLPDGAALEVCLRWRGDGDAPDDQLVMGRLAWRHRQAWFEYDAEFLHHGLNPSPLHLPLRAGVRAGEPTFSGLHGVFQDSLPDAWGQLLVDRRALALGVSPTTLTPLDRLAIVGARGMGALTYRPARTDDVPNDAIDLNQLADQSTRILAGRPQEVLPALLAAGGSPGGARPKVLVAWRPTDGHLIHGADQIETGYQPLLVKFGGPGDPLDSGAIELAYAHMALAAGLRMMPSRLLPSTHGPGFFATDRFDRPQSPGQTRLHAHTLGGLLHADHRIPSLDYDALFRLTRHLTRDHREVAQAFRLMAFNVMAHNRDDHAKQFSFLMDRVGAWQLAPAYDLTFSEGPGGEHSTSIGGEGRAPGVTHMMALASSAQIKNPRHVLDEVATAVSDWRRFAAAAGVSRASMLRIQARLVLN